MGHSLLGGILQGQASVKLAPDWQDWVVSNALDGVDAATLIETLKDGGVPEDIATGEVHQILASPGLRGARRERAQRQRRDHLFQLLRALEEARGVGIERQAGVDADCFYQDYVYTMRPVVLTDVCADWPARTTWTPRALATALNEVQVCIGRDSRAHPDQDFAALTTTMPMAEYVQRVADAGQSNDLYMIAHNDVASLPEFAPLLDDIVPPPGYLDGPLAASFWYGPAGTLTPLHHDNTHILFCQLRGRKRFRLVAPWSIALSTEASGFYAPRPALDYIDEGELAYEIELQPGEALYLPGFWWHEVHALDESMSLSLLNFRRPTGFDWYSPGSVFPQSVRTGDDSELV